MSAKKRDGSHEFVSAPGCHCLDPVTRELSKGVRVVPRWASEAHVRIETIWFGSGTGGMSLEWALTEWLATRPEGSEDPPPVAPETFARAYFAARLLQDGDAA